MLDSNDNDTVSLIYTLSEELTRRKISVYARLGNVPGELNINALKLLEKTGRFRRWMNWLPWTTFYICCGMSPTPSGPPLSPTRWLSIGLGSKKIRNLIIPATPVPCYSDINGLFIFGYANSVFPQIGLLSICHF